MNMTTVEFTSESWEAYQARYRAGGWRAPIFRDMVLADIRAAGAGAAVLDIGCGRGFDGDARLQRSLAEAAGSYLGVEPDTSIVPEDCFAQIYPSILEEAAIPSGSVHVAFAVMVLEHLERPQPFWDKLHDVLAEGGVFWGFTMDGRHRFCRASLLAERLSIKDLYLRFLRGKRGAARYENYSVHYHCNTPAQIGDCARAFRECDFVSFARVGQLNYYVPRPLRPVTNCMDRWDLRRNRPGSILAVRVAK
jgi:SAM-dependent methyltransferase